ncbi:hypothetical protein KCV87_31245 [Actinosynnema pretiosum subsp. pretiosum]|uniref:Serine/threonine protein kinase n=1 Tax=Actinosynnema pretiosum subsp. pretiosum TaxID=103721 RepID=A0AA45R3P6_9PSEU|nr:hypothetical protein KCV87_31245 [Actinosynnema pretiosum subsp. pretiosum]
MGAGRYRLIRELGRGGMGVVWLGQDAVLGRDVAVKELLLPVKVPEAERAVYRERVLREARIASRLSDPAVVIGPRPDHRERPDLRRHGADQGPRPSESHPSTRPRPCPTYVVTATP